MLTLSTSDTLAYAASARSYGCTVEVYSTVLSAWVDLSDHCGYDWVKSVEIREAIDQPIATATVDLFTFAGPSAEISASPFVTGGIFNYAGGAFVANGALLLPYKQIRIKLAVAPVDSVPAASNYVLAFTGRINEVAVNVDSIRLTCRDQCGELADLFVEATKKTYAQGTADVEDVIQDILDDWGGGVDLWSPTGTIGTKFQVADSPGWVMRPFVAQRLSVLDSIRRLVDMIGWDLRIRYLANASDRVLVLSEPDRAMAAADVTFTMGALTRFSASMSLASIRNVVRVGYYKGQLASQSRYVDGNTTEGTTSEGYYGRRYMELAEDVSSEIDSSTEAQAMADAIEKDLALPEIVAQITTRLYPHIELQDGVGITGDNVLVSNQTILGVDSITHTVNLQGAYTSLTLRGRPASHRAWTQSGTIARTNRIGAANLKSGSVASLGTNLIPNGDLNQWSKN